MYSISQYSSKWLFGPGKHRLNADSGIIRPHIAISHLYILDNQAIGCYIRHYLDTDYSSKCQFRTGKHRDIAFSADNWPVRASRTNDLKPA